MITFLKKLIFSLPPLPPRVFSLASIASFASAILRPLGSLRPLCRQATHCVLSTRYSGLIDVHSGAFPVHHALDMRDALFEGRHIVRRGGQLLQGCAGTPALRVLRGPLIWEVFQRLNPPGCQ